MKAIQLLTLLLLTYSAPGQEFKELYGEWQIKKYTSFLIVRGETADEMKERLLQEELCLKGSLKIDSGGIHANNTCEIFDCTLTTISPRIVHVPVVDDNNKTLDEYGAGSGYGIITDSMVGRKFLTYIADNYRQQILTLFDTKCLVDYGGWTLKILLIDHEHIAFYRDFDLIVMQRKEKAKPRYHRKRNFKR